MDAESVDKPEIASSNGFPVPTIKKEDDEDTSCEISWNNVDGSTVKVENEIEKNDNFECNAEATPAGNGCENTPFRLTLIDDDGNILETYVEENGTLKQIAGPKDEAEIKISENLKFKKKLKRKKSCKKHVFDEAFRNENYCCSLCKNKFKGRKSFKDHLSLHIKEENSRFWCCFCGYSARLRGHLNTHFMRKHIHFSSIGRYDERIFSCKICEKKFFERKDLKRHMFIHTLKGNFKCRFCEFSHIRKSCLDNHMREFHKASCGSVSPQKHSEKTAETCECHYCGYKCVGKRSITVHIEQHLGVFRYKCDQCGYTCLFSSDLKKHIASHSNKRPFVCGICSKGFKRKDHLLLHNKKSKSCKGKVKNFRTEK